MFENKFTKQDKNSDYSKKIDEFFSDDHLFYSTEGYIGFGDYSIIGNDYNEGGFAPYAVAIHIVYFNENNELRVHHFVSDSNNDTKNTSEKFYEAVSKLANWYSNGNQSQSTTALNILLSHYANETYPGLPTLKKLSVMHHLELMGRFLDTEEGK
jgi:hypothetical protein